jgi:chorismate-pyruvate lyase
VHRRDVQSPALFVRTLLLLSLLPLPLSAQQALKWRDTHQSRLEIVALTQTLSAEILASPSATRSLEKWCRDHRMAAEPRIVARLTAGVAKQPSVQQLQRLQVSSADELRYRRVQLSCGAHVLSEADNWYVPARLTPEMNRLLETTDTPFGIAVQPLQPYRRTLSAALLWRPLEPGWEQRPRTRWRCCRRRLLAIPNELFEHRAVLYTSEHIPFAEVQETYQSALLAFDRSVSSAPP